MWMKDFFFPARLNYREAACYCIIGSLLPYYMVTRSLHGHKRLANLLPLAGARTRIQPIMSGVKHHDFRLLGRKIAALQRNNSIVTIYSEFDEVPLSVQCHTLVMFFSTTPSLFILPSSAFRTPYAVSCSLLGFRPSARFLHATFP